MTAAKFEPLIFSVWGLALSNFANIFMILDDFCLLQSGQMAVRMSALRTGRDLLPESNNFLLLEVTSVTG
jgi:hypothetical protein